MLAAADVQFARGRSTDAIRYYARSLEADPSRADAHLGLAQVEAVQKKSEQARQSSRVASA